MTKHFVGFGLFALIVGIFIGTALVIPYVSIPEIEPVDQPQLWKSDVWFCEPGFDNGKVQIRQAFVDRRSGRFTFDLSIETDHEFAELDLRNVRVALDLYVLSNGEARFLTSIRDEIIPDFKTDGKAEGIVSYSLPKFSDLKYSENLYVIPQVLLTDRDPNVKPKFNRALATAVLTVNN